MGKLSKEHARRRRAEIRQLLNEWDPIGVMGGADSPVDEYDCLAGPLLRLLERNASNEKILNFLSSELEDHFGLGHYGVDDIAKRSKMWFEERWGGSFV
jgi:hypothetical protein